jgi:hypothetical protein
MSYLGKNPCMGMDNRSFRGNDNCIRGSTIKGMPESFERLRFCLGRRNDSPCQGSIRHPLAAAGNDIDGAAISRGNPGRDKNRQEIILQDTEILHLYRGEKPEEIGGKPFPVGNKSKLAERFLSIPVRSDGMVEKRTDRTNAAPDPCAERPVTAPDKEGIFPEIIPHATV